MEKVLDEISFHAPDLVKPPLVTHDSQPAAKQPNLPALHERTNDNGATDKVLLVTREYVQQQVASIVKNQDLSRYIL
jgi:ATP-dependent HslUV protease ATP-binding subunit HslU